MVIDTISEKDRIIEIMDVFLKHVPGIYSYIIYTLIGEGIVERHHESSIHMEEHEKGTIDYSIFIIVDKDYNIFHRKLKFVIRPDHSKHVLALRVYIELEIKPELRKTAENEFFSIVKQENPLTPWDNEDVFDVDLKDLEYHIKDKLIELKSRESNGVFEPSY